MLRHHSTKNLKLMGFNPTILYILITHTYDIFLMWDSNISTFTHVSPSLHCYTSPQTEALFLFLFLFSLFFFFFFINLMGSLRDYLLVCQHHSPLFLLQGHLFVSTSLHLSTIGYLLNSFSEP